MTTITVTKGGPGHAPSRAVVEADVRGPFAVFKTDDYPDYWSITHVPTGRAVAWRPTRREARALVDALAALPVDWGSVDVDDGARLLRDVPGLRKVLGKEEA